MPNLVNQLDVRVPRPPFTGQRVTVTFHVGPRLEQWSERIEIYPNTPRLDSPVNDENRTIAVTGVIWWGKTEVFRSNVLLVKPGDTFTFNFEGDGGR